jgi:hypothetical protein
VHDQIDNALHSEAKYLKTYFLLFVGNEPPPENEKRKNINI